MLGANEDHQLLDDGSNVNFAGAGGHHFSHCDLGFAAYHPRKELDDWNGCYDELKACKDMHCTCIGRPCGWQKGSYGYYCCDGAGL